MGGAYDEKADEWSCGVILYILLSGTPPFGGDTDDQILKEVKKGRIDFEEDPWPSISSSAKTVIKHLCDRDPTRRWTAQRTLEEKWMQRGFQHHQIDLPATFMKNLKEFSRVGRFKKAALHVIVHQLEDAKIKSLRESFMGLDGNGDGMLTLQEMQEGFKKAGVSDTSELETVFKSLDADGSGQIDYGEFLAASVGRKEYLKDEVCWEAFRTFDTDGSGKISLDELKAMLGDDMTGVAGVIGKQNIEDVLKEADTNKDGQIDFEEFMAMLRK